MHNYPQVTDKTFEVQGSSLLFPFLRSLAREHIQEKSPRIESVEGICVAVPSLGQ